MARPIGSNRVGWPGIELVTTPLPKARQRAFAKRNGDSYFVLVSRFGTWNGEVQSPETTWQLLPPSQASGVGKDQVCPSAVAGLQG